MQNKTYVGMGFDRNGVIKVSINLDKFRTVANKALKQGRKNVTLFVARKRQKGKYGDDYTVYEFVPNQPYQVYNRQQQPQPQQYQPQPLPQQCQPQLSQQYQPQLSQPKPQPQQYQPQQGGRLDYNANANTPLSNELGW